MSVAVDPVAELFTGARAQRDRGDYAGAEASLRQLLELAPRHVDGLGDLAECLRAQGREQEAATVRGLADGAAVDQLVRAAFALFGTAMEPKAEALIGQAVQRFPHQEAGHCAMIDWLRRNGRWREAHAYGRRARDLCAPAPMLQARLHAFEGDRPPASSSDLVPAPFRAIGNFLSAAERAQMVDLAIRLQPEAMRSTINWGDVDEGARKSRSLAVPDEVKAMFEPKLRAAAAGLWRGLGRRALPTGRIGMDFVAHNDGDFYTFHQDSGAGGLFSLRRLSFVYYFIGQPRKFEGGDLLLFDRGVPNDLLVRERYTRVPVEDNQLLVFASDVWHEITKVRCPSGRYEDGRFSIVGWLAADPTHEQ